jgi:hypothetical protein
MANYMCPLGFIYVSSDSHHLAIHMKNELIANSRFRLILATELSEEPLRRQWVEGGLFCQSSYVGVEKTTTSLSSEEAEVEVMIGDESVLLNDDLDEGEGVLDDGIGWFDFNPLV